MYNFLKKFDIGKICEIICYFTMERAQFLQNLKFYDKKSQYCKKSMILREKAAITENLQFYLKVVFSCQEVVILQKLIF